MPALSLIVMLFICLYSKMQGNLVLGQSICQQNLNTLPITFKLLVLGLSYFTCKFLVTSPFFEFPTYLTILSWILTYFCKSLLNFNLCHNFRTIGAKAFMCIACIQTFLWLPKVLTLKP